MSTDDARTNLGLVQHLQNERERFAPARTGLDHFCFDIPSVDALHAWARRFDRLGIKSSGPYSTAGEPVWRLTLCDPDGIALELIAFEPPRTASGDSRTAH